MPTAAHARQKAGRRHAMWSGAITFGLVNIPIRLEPGVRKKTVHFHLVHEKDNARLRRRYVCSLEHKEVPEDEVKKAYDLSKREQVIMEKEELDKLKPEATHTLDILYFVNQNDVDPAYFSSPYYLRPEATAQKPYELLVQALKNTGKAGIAQWVMHNKQYIGLIRADENVLALETMHFDDEVVTVNELDWAPKGIRVNSRELKAAEELVESLATAFEPEKLKDEYREKVLQMIDRKAAQPRTKESAEEDEEKEAPEVIDLMSALRKSLEQVKKNKKRAA